MKKITLITLIVFLFILPASLKSQWVQISTIGNNELRGVKFFNEHTGVVVGQGGIWRSTNSGVNWMQTLSGSNMNSLSFPDNNNGYAVGDSGRIYRTFDNGQTWSQQISNVFNHLFSVSFYNLSTGYTVGQNGVILRTTNGGSFWYQNVNSLSQDLNCVQMVINGNSAFAVGSSINELFTSTANGGTNWVYSLMIPNNSLHSLNYIPGLSGNIVAVGGNGRIRRTTNFGGTWTLISNPTSQMLNEVLFIDANTGYIVGNTGVILKTVNSGFNWIEQSSSTTNNLQSLWFINQNTGWAVGAFGTVLRTGIPVGIQNNNSETPKSFIFYQNYPNPFNPVTNIKFDIAHEGHVTLAVFNIIGEKIATILESYLKAGNYSLNANFTDFASGAYFCLMTCVNESYRTFRSTIKIILQK